MTIIPVVGRKSFRMRAIIFALYAVLTLGAVSTIYPFLLMIGTSITSNVDINDYRVVPEYVVDDGALFVKYAEAKYNGNLDLLNGDYRTNFAKLEDILPPEKRPENEPGIRKYAEDWLEFSKSVPVTDKEACFRPYLSGPSNLLERYKEFLKKRFKNDVTLLNRTYTEENETFQTITLPFERATRPEWYPEKTPKMLEWMQFKKNLPPYFMRVVGAEPLWAVFLSENLYDGKVENLNKAWGTSYASFADIALPHVVPADSPRKEAWEEFVRTKLPYRYIRISPDGARAYRAMLQGRYGKILALNEKYHTRYASFTEIAIPKVLPSEGPELLDYMDFIEKIVPMASIQLEHPEKRFRDFLVRKYGSLEGINKAFGTHHASLSGFLAPVQEADWLSMKIREGDVRKDFILRNYRMVLNYILLHGRAVLNTVILCLCVIVTHLIVNPLCAYALSRFNLAYSYKVLLFLLATMSFPAEVAAIPNFLLLKKLHMLNTFWALILPGMANGFSIFLLKGFFDSLPRELYEAGILDGASEMRMFYGITIPLSKPIFAVIALQSFTHAYASWLWALVVCQDQKMWTLMVWLYEMQTWAPKFVMLAALTLTAIPTLLIFAFCQNVIMRGIILPTEH